MKLQILYFVAAGIVLERHRIAAKAIVSAAPECSVVFRNATVAETSGESPEKCAGVAGIVPTPYAEVRPRFNDDGSLFGEPVETLPEAPEDGEPGELNPLGLPAGQGHPEDRETLKTALEGAGVEFHPSTATAKLVELYRQRWQIG